MRWSLFRSKTFWGGVILGVAQIIAEPTPEGVMKGVGTLLAAAGIRDALYKVNPAGTEQVNRPTSKEDNAP